MKNEKPGVGRPLLGPEKKQKVAQTDRHTHTDGHRDLNTESAEWADSVKMLHRLSRWLMKDIGNRKQFLLHERLFNTFGFLGSLEEVEVRDHI